MPCQEPSLPFSPFRRPPAPRRRTSWGQGGFADISQALAAATHGDVVLVHPGNYSAFLTTLGVKIRALVPGTVNLVTGLGTGFNLAPSRDAHVVGVSGAWVFVLGGTVTLDQCTIVGTPTGTGGVQVSDATLVLQSCTVRGLPVFSVLPSASLGAANAVVTCIDCTIEGSDAPLFFGSPGPAVRVQNSELRMVSSNARGGNGPQQPTAVAVDADAASRVWLAD